ncbi:hypothetical protein SAMN05444156_0998 [Verrucomicrobium sp. GAS474]|uniref:D-lyxose/D-mannose family sugar isomerase n=1 Tax=Verrucomicrobium sp. GAS474 TaxID=1882831 RepID=UPI00087A7613|nr:D-lyxose/D-mannose family sugar isomerase [Verrucomicrobium sp. GAS474]SDT94978.1 hypothetical protein SAMN05444156_0998 [Verrucomicrobium sp. GAS474]
MTPSGTLSRSLVNHSVEVARAVLAALHIPLPPFADWSVDQWDGAAGAKAAEIRDCMLGWDVTDFGSGRFSEIGRCLFTLRNGRPSDPRYPKSYAEKLLIEPEGQKSPMHYHRSKREDIINRGGGDVIIVLRPVGPGERPGDGPLTVQIDGFSHARPAGEEIRIRPGESLSIPPRTFHQFWAAEGSGTPIAGGRYAVSSEVSSVCDDWNDNVFADPWACRFPTLLEDAPRTCYLCHEYPTPRS